MAWISTFTGQYLLRLQAGHTKYKHRILRAALHSIINKIPLIFLGDVFEHIETIEAIVISPNASTGKVVLDTENIW
jgi:hypothetical protein